MKCKCIAIDIEGINLGSHGVLSLIQIATSISDIYIFDVLTLKHDLFNASNLLPLLSNPSILKLCFDARCDCETLFFQYGIRVHGFYDLQIVYTIFFQPNNDPFLKGLHKAMQAPGLSLDADDLNHKINLKKTWSLHQTYEFFHRPLSEALLQYCASDVSCLMQMYAQWSSKILSARVIWMTHQRIINHIYKKKNNFIPMSRVDFHIPQMHFYARKFNKRRKGVKISQTMLNTARIYQ